MGEQHYEKHNQSWRNMHHMPKKNGSRLRSLRLWGATQTLAQSKGSSLLELDDGSSHYFRRDAY